jgi:hypothetical protein
MYLTAPSRWILFNVYAVQWGRFSIPAVMAVNIFSVTRNSLRTSRFYYVFSRSTHFGLVIKGRLDLGYGKVLIILPVERSLCFISLVDL